MAVFHHVMIFGKVINRLLLRLAFTAIADDDEVKDDDGYMGIKVAKPITLIIN